LQTREENLELASFLPSWNYLVVTRSSFEIYPKYKCSLESFKNNLRIKITKSKGIKKLMF
jgi:hypothetical protein